METATTKVFVGRLAWETRDDGLKEFFEKIGPVLDAKVIMDNRTGRSKGYGFVTFESLEAAVRAVAEGNDAELDGRTIKVAESQDRPRDGSSYRPYRRNNDSGFSDRNNGDRRGGYRSRYTGSSGGGGGYQSRSNGDGNSGYQGRRNYNNGGDREQRSYSNYRGDNNSREQQD